MYQSLQTVMPSFMLTIFCFDDESHRMLSALNLENVVLVTMKEFETDGLKQVKTERTRGEYCWTCTPHVIRHVLDRFGVDQVTYLDADLYFYGNPAIMLDEFEQSGGSVLITEHRYTPRYDQARTSGVYCVQFISFRDDTRGRAALDWWADRCLEWCYARCEDGKFGDQKYLDDWPARFPGVHVLRHLGGGVAPWNVQQYRVTAGPRVNDVPVIFYHFHNFAWFFPNRFDLGKYRLSPEAVTHLYMPYLSHLERAMEQLRQLAPGFSRGKQEQPRDVVSLLKKIKRMMLGEYNVIQR